jgi:hypothetical protein
MIAGVVGGQTNGALALIDGGVPPFESEVDAAGEIEGFGVARTFLWQGTDSRQGCIRFTGLKGGVDFAKRIVRGGGVCPHRSHEDAEEKNQRRFESTY